MFNRFRLTPDRLVILGLVLTAAVYCRDVSYDFVLDDVPLILMNENLASWRNWGKAFTSHIFSSAGPLVPAVHYRPVYVLWLLLNQQLFGAVVPWWHLTSLLLHLAAILLVYQIGVKVLRDNWSAALAALLFAFHPIHVEAVAYVSASTDLLVTLFALLSFLFYVQFREEDAGSAYWGLSILAAALAILSKESGAMLPWMLVAYEGLREPSPPENWRRFAWTLPFFAVVAGYVAIRMALFGRNVVPGAERLGGVQNVPIVLVAYLRNILWPLRMSLYYPPQWATQWTLFTALAIALAVVLPVVLWKFYREEPGLRLQLLWAPILLVPALSGVFIFAQDDWIHDRHMYLASVPFCLIAAALLRDAKLPRSVSACAGLLILMTLFFQTATQLPRFSDEVTLYRSTLRVAPSSAIARNHYAAALWSSGQHDQALLEYRLVTELAPDSAFFDEEYGAALSAMGRDDEAMVQYTKALQFAKRPTPLRALILYSLAVIEVSHCKSAAGADHLREALRISPQARGYHALLARALRQEGRAQEADEELKLEVAAKKRVAFQKENAKSTTNLPQYRGSPHPDAADTKCNLLG